jgi:4a-hydroxytetrahydrobiopterin dehydratase
MTTNETRTAVPRNEAQALSGEEARRLAVEIPDWTLKDKEITRDFRFPDFRRAMDFVRRVADLAESQDHHPDILISYNRVTLTLSTHKIGGLSGADFALASLINRAAPPERPGSGAGPK